MTTAARKSGTRISKNQISLTGHFFKSADGPIRFKDITRDGGPRCSIFVKPSLENVAKNMLNETVKVISTQQENGTLAITGLNFT